MAPGHAELCPQGRMSAQSRVGTARMQDFPVAGADSHRTPVSSAQKEAGCQDREAHGWACFGPAQFRASLHQCGHHDSHSRPQHPGWLILPPAPPPPAQIVPPLNLHCGQACRMISGPTVRARFKRERDDFQKEGGCSYRRQRSGHWQEMGSIGGKRRKEKRKVWAPPQTEQERGDLNSSGPSSEVQKMGELRQPQ